MKTVRFNTAVEHRFVFADGENPAPQNDLAHAAAYPVSDPVDIPDADLKAQVWRIPAGAEFSVTDRDADRLGKLQDADGHTYIGEPGTPMPERAALVAPDPTDPNDRTPREEVERVASDAGHTLEGKIQNIDGHRAFAERAGVAPGGEAATPAAPVTSPTTRLQPPRPTPPPSGAAAPPPPGTAPGPRPGAPALPGATPAGSPAPPAPARSGPPASPSAQPGPAAPAGAAPAPAPAPTPATARRVDLGPARPGPTGGG